MIDHHRIRERRRRDRPLEVNPRLVKSRPLVQHPAEAVEKRLIIRLGINRDADHRLSAIEILALIGPSVPKIIVGRSVTRVDLDHLGENFLGGLRLVDRLIQMRDRIQQIRIVTHCGARGVQHARRIGEPLLGRVELHKILDRRAILGVMLAFALEAADEFGWPADLCIKRLQRGDRLGLVGVIVEDLQQNRLDVIELRRAHGACAELHGGVEKSRVQVGRIGGSPERDDPSFLQVGMFLVVVIEQHGVRLLVTGSIAQELPEQLLEALLVAEFSQGKGVGELKIRRRIAGFSGLCERVDGRFGVVLVEQ